MKRLLQLAGLLLSLASVCLAVDQKTQPQPASLPVGSAVVAKFKGDVSLRSPTGEALAPRPGLVLDAESTIEIGKGSLLLNLRDGSEVLIQSHSRVVLKSPAAEGGFYLQLLLGKLMAKIRKRLGEEPAFRIGTPSAVITVRGTRFEVRVNKKNHTYVEVFDGVVLVQGLVPNSPAVLLQPGFSTDVAPNRIPTPPRRVNDISDFFNRTREGAGQDNGGSGPRQTTPQNLPQGGGENQGHERPDD
jgi:hypothetical protein